MLSCPTRASHSNIVLTCYYPPSGEICDIGSSVHDGGAMLAVSGSWAVKSTQVAKLERLDLARVHTVAKEDQLSMFLSLWRILP